MQTAQHNYIWPDFIEYSPHTILGLSQKCSIPVSRVDTRRSTWSTRSTRSTPMNTATDECVAQFQNQYILWLFFLYFQTVAATTALLCDSFFVRSFLCALCFTWVRPAGCWCWDGLLNRMFAYMCSSSSFTIINIYAFIAVIIYNFAGLNTSAHASNKYIIIHLYQYIIHALLYSRHKISISVYL